MDSQHTTKHARYSAPNDPQQPVDGLTEEQRVFARVVAQALAEAWQSKLRQSDNPPPNRPPATDHSA